MFTSTLMNSLLSVIVFSALGVVIFSIAFVIMVKVSPFSVVKEIEEDQNIALGILFGSVFISLSIVIAAALT